ncbi:MAG: hypothetical protein ACI4XA_04315, partial [Oscillospiraceae bacterium]
LRMKHEALVDAITMLDDDIIAEANEPFRRRRPLPIIGACTAAAACAAAGIIIFLSGRNGTDILVMGADPSEKAVTISSPAAAAVTAAAVDVRAYAMDATDISVEITSAGTTVVDVSGGELLVVEDDKTLPAELPLEISGEASLIWSVPLWDAGAEFELTARSGGNSRVLLLSFDDSTQEWIVSEEKPRQ